MELATYFVTFLVAASIAASLTPISRWLAVKLGAIDRPDERRIHRVAKPRLGGIAIAVAILIPVACVILIRSSSFTALTTGKYQMIAFFAGGIIIALVGALDDIKGLRAKTKFAVQCLVAVVVWLAGFRFRYMGIPFLGAVELPFWLDLALSVLWIAGVINAINLIDGLDGLASGVTFFVASTNLVLALRSGNELGALFAATIAGSVIGFLLFNWNPAILFMGDTGSMFLGYVLATTSIITSQKVSTAVAMVVPLVAMGIPVIDTLLSIIRRFLENRSLFSPDKGHIHHRLIRAGLTQRRAVLVIYGLCIVFAGASIAITAARDIEAAVVMSALAVVVIGIIRFFGFFNVFRVVRGAFRRSQIVDRLRLWLPKFSIDVSDHANSVYDVWEKFNDLCRKVEFIEVSWRTAGINPPDSRKSILVYERSEDPEKASHRGHNKVTSSAQIESRSYVEISFVYPSRLGRVNLEVDTELQIVTDTVAAALKRLHQNGLWEKVDISHPTQLCDSRPTAAGNKINSDRTDNDQEVSPMVLKNAMTDCEKRNPLLDKVWERFLVTCMDNGFVGAGWQTFGIKKVDTRRANFEVFDEEALSFVTRSVTITPLAFVELKFVYRGKPGNRTPYNIRQAVKKIGLRIGSDLRKLLLDV